jgi:hypothetical protein
LSKSSLHQKETASQLPTELHSLRCNDAILYYYEKNPQQHSIIFILSLSIAFLQIDSLKWRSEERRCIQIIANKSRADETINHFRRYCSYWSTNCLHGVSSDRGFEK